MSLEPASDRFLRLVYSTMLATGDSRDKAWAECASVHKETYAAYQEETAAQERAARAANDREEAAKEDRRSQRAQRRAKVEDAIEAAQKASPGMDYSTAYRKVERENPGLFAGMQDPTANK